MSPVRCTEQGGVIGSVFLFWKELFVGRNEFESQIYVRKK